MRAPLSWLREFAPLDGDPADLAAALSDLGLVVEGVERVGEALDQVVVARVVATRPHPGADKVQLVDVEGGSGSTVQVVCGAFNFGPGDLVPLAPAGTVLPGGMEIGRRRVRGEWSEGMLCSAAELRLSDDHSGILVLPPGLEPGTPLGEALEIFVDVVFDLDVTPNRPDALSIAGVARDLAARLRVPFAVPEPAGDRARAEGPIRARVEVEDDAVELCPRFTASPVEGVVVGPSPPWLARRLTLAGMRPINNVVDVSNYVMLELGQPNHPYDLDRLGGGGLLVRRGRSGESLTTLDGVERQLGPDDCLICDAEGEAVGIGGIMGGATGEITGTTARVLLEAAWFSPLAIARTSKRLGLRTEASVRFERGVDPEGVERAVARYMELLGPLTPDARRSATVDARAPAPGPGRVVVRTARVNSILGTELSPDQVRDYLEPLGFGCRPLDGAGDPGRFEVTVPSWRPDATAEIDVIEEVGRHHGYRRIARTLPARARTGSLDGYQRHRRHVREVLAGAGVSEAWTTSFLAPEDLERAGLAVAVVEVENPLAREESVLRPSLLPGLLRALVTNASHRHPDVGLFEIGRVFGRPEEGEQLPREREMVGVALGRRDAAEAARLWRVLVGALALEQAVLRAAALPGLHPSRAALALAGGAEVGAVGEVDPDVVGAHGLEGRVGWLELDLGLLLAAPRRPAVYRPVSRFPSADIDLAFEVDEGVAAGHVEQVLAEAAADLLEELTLFDVFRGPPVGDGRRSLAWRLRFAALDHTLTDEELAAVRRRCIDAVESTFAARLRG